MTGGLSALSLAKQDAFGLSLQLGNCLAVMAKMPARSIDVVVRAMLAPSHK